MIYLRKISGHSMEPTIKSGQFAVFVKWFTYENAVVLAQHNNIEVVKRLINNKLVGDNKSSHHNIDEKFKVKGRLCAKF